MLNQMPQTETTCPDGCDPRTCTAGPVLTVTCTYLRIVEVFGAAEWVFDGRTSAEWRVRSPHGLACIYDYDDGGPWPQDVTEWHIGGHNTDSAQWVVDRLAGTPH